MNKRELEEELKKTSAGRVFLEEAEQEKHTNKLIEFAKDHDKMIGFAKEQCEIFPEDSYMGKYLRETIKILQAEPCEDAISREDVIKAIDRHTFNTDDGLCLDEDITIILEEVAPKQDSILNKIKAEIEQTEINGHIRDIECFRAGINVALNVINKYKAGE